MTDEPPITVDDVADIIADLEERDNPVYDYELDELYTILNRLNGDN